MVGGRYLEVGMLTSKRIIEIAKANGLVLESWMTTLPKPQLWHMKHDSLLAFARALEAELLSGAGEDARDAARYRWLRKQSWDEGMLCVVAWPRQAVRLGHDCPSLQRLDAAIDAALSTIEGQEGSSAIRSGTIRKE
jgi:hypothetical protein